MYKDQKEIVVPLGHQELTDKMDSLGLQVLLGQLAVPVTMDFQEQQEALE